MSLHTEFNVNLSPNLLFLLPKVVTIFVWLVYSKPIFFNSEVNVTFSNFDGILNFLLVIKNERIRIFYLLKNKKFKLQL